MSILQIGPGFAWITDLNAATSDQVKYAFAQIKGGKVEWKPKQEFLSGNQQIDMYAANISGDITGEFKFGGIEAGLLMAIFFKQYAQGSAQLSKIATLDDPKTVTTNAITITTCESVLQVRTPIALGGVPAGGLLKRIVSGTPTTGQYTVTGEGTASTTITFATADGTALGTQQPLVTWVKKASAESNRIILQNAIHQQSIYFGVEGVGFFDGKQVNYKLTRSMATDLPALFDGSEKFAERVLKTKHLADPYTGLIGEISFTEVLS